MCKDHAARFVECYAGYAGHEAMFELPCACALEDAAAVGPECSAAVLERHVCLTTADCGPLLRGAGCDAEATAASKACEA